jgi:hypothetical protein
MKSIYNSSSISDKVAKMTIDAQFENLLNTAKENNGGIQGNVWCALDTSGSMGVRVSPNSNLSAYDVCISLGIYFSSLNEGDFHKNVIMFDACSKIKQLTGSFSEMYSQIAKTTTAWGNTDFQSIIDEIVRIRKTRPNVSLEEYPNTILVVSDMQFDDCGRYSNYDTMKRKLYEVFPKEFVDSMKFIWWQVNGKRTKDVPATLNDGGCYFISGFDGSVISTLLGGESQVIDEKTGKKRLPSMEELIYIVMNQEVLNLLKIS